MIQLQFIDQQRFHYSIGLLYQVLHVVPSRYYAWRKEQGCGAAQRVEPAWEKAMVDVFDEPQHRYGTRRL